MRTYLALALGASLALTMIACDSADPAPSELAFSKQDKVTICHVGNELPEYDRDCDPLLETCGDAGKVDLISVANPAKHLDNPEHTYGEVGDYLPGSVDGASGEGDMDSDGDGIDDGCDACPVDSPGPLANYGCPEVTVSCPCFTAADLAPIDWITFLDSEVKLYTPNGPGTGPSSAQTGVIDPMWGDGPYHCTFIVDFVTVARELSIDEATYLECKAIIEAEWADEQEE